MNETALEPLADADLMPSGRVSQPSRLSLKALRLYDALSLLPPAYVDPASSYRYYREAQLRNARLIGLLRGLETLLSRIARVSELSGADAAQEVALYGREVEAEAASRRKLVRYIGEWLEGKGKRMFEVPSREVAEQKVLSVQRNVFVKELSPSVGETVDTLYRHLTKTAGLEPAGPCFVVCHNEVSEDSNGPAEACLPYRGVAERAGECGASPTPLGQRRRRPARLLASGAQARCGPSR